MLQSMPVLLFNTGSISVKFSMDDECQAILFVLSTISYQLSTATALEPAKTRFQDERLDNVFAKNNINTQSRL